MKQKEHITSFRMKDKIKRLDKISFRILKIIILFSGIIFILFLGINALGYQINTVSCTKSMYPYLDCPCYTIDKEYDRYYSNYINETYLNETMNNILLEKNLTQLNASKLYETLKLYDKENMINNLIKNDVKIGDVITFQAPEGYGRGYIIHRVVDKCYETDIIEVNDIWTTVNTTVQKGFVTKGDNNQNIDSCIPFDKIEEKMIYKTC